MGDCRPLDFYPTLPENIVENVERPVVSAICDIFPISCMLQAVYICKIVRPFS